jgi:hypothetical protein
MTDVADAGAPGMPRCVRPDVDCAQCSRRRPVFLVGTTRDDLQRVVGQWPLQRLGFVPRRAHPNVPLPLVVKVTGMALGWIGSTMAFGAVVRKP